MIDILTRSRNYVYVISVTKGMSTEECDRLEQEEIAADEEEDKKKRNVLLDLMKNYDAVNSQ